MRRFVGERERNREVQTETRLLSLQFLLRGQERVPSAPRWPGDPSAVWRTGKAPVWSPPASPVQPGDLYHPAGADLLGFAPEGPRGAQHKHTADKAARVVPHGRVGKLTNGDACCSTRKMGCVASLVCSRSRFKVAPHLSSALSPISIMSVIAKQRRCCHSRLPLASDCRWD